MMPIPGVLAGALARSVKRGKLAILGRALPLLNNPLMVAEEYAMLDNLTRGRFIAGFVRGIGAEYHATGVNPVLSQERFAEAHDLIVRAWTEPGPFAYEGKHYHFNYVNPWPRPYQSPHPPIWIPSQGSSSTIRWAAAMRYTYAQTLSPIAAVARFFQMYRDEAEKAGYQASPDQLAWSNTIYVADTDEKAMREARPHLEALVNRLLKMPTEMLLPPGYTNIESMKRVRAAKVTGDLDRGPGQDRRRHHRQPQHRAGKARRISGPRGLQYVADQDPVRHDAGRHDARQHDGDRRRDFAAFPRSPAAGREAGGGGMRRMQNCQGGPP
jgi:alkanesulfonate monooxygenase SsuD/methylene tetrahydromethanopterin reductase-like flavin-dependent oxidoreductase (luciferase family)